MSQEAADFVVDNGTGAAVRADLNKILDSILTNNSGSSVPSYAKAYTLWADTGNNVMKIRNAANDGFIELFQLDGTITLEDGSASTPALAFRNDLNTGIYQSGADKLNIATGGVERMELGSSTIFNEGGASIDFRIESDTQTHAFFLDASESFISMGTASPNAPLHVKTSVSDQRAILKLETFQPKIRFQDNTASAHSGEIKQDGDALRFNISVPADDTTDLDEKMRIDSGGRFMLGLTSVLDSTNSSFNITGLTSGARIATQGTTTSANSNITEFFAHWTTNKVAGFTMKSGSDTTNKDDGSMHFFTNPGSGLVEALTILNNQKVGVNNTSPSEVLHVTGNILATGTITPRSDIAFKKDVKPLTNVLDKVTQLIGINFTYKNNNEKSMGLIAQDVEKFFPELIRGEEGSKSLNYMGLTGALVEAIKELSAKVAALEAA